MNVQRLIILTSLVLETGLLEHYVLMVRIDMTIPELYI